MLDPNFPKPKIFVTRQFLEDILLEDADANQHFGTALAQSPQKVPARHKEDEAAAQDTDDKPTPGDCAGPGAKPPNNAGSMQADGAATPGSASKAAAAGRPPPEEDGPTAAGPPDAD